MNLMSSKTVYILFEIVPAKKQRSSLKGEGVGLAMKDRSPRRETGIYWRRRIVMTRQLISVVGDRITNLGVAMMLYKNGMSGKSRLRGDPASSNIYRSFSQLDSCCPSKSAASLTSSPSRLYRGP
jgi:hypothetical protein